MCNVFHSGSCTSCNCNTAGSLTNKCSERGVCDCKDNVKGDKCDQCQNGIISLQQNNKYDCSGGTYGIRNRRSIVLSNV